MSSGAYLLAHVASQEDLIPAAKQLSEIESVTRWDAVDGHVNIILKTSNIAEVKAALESVSGIDQTLAYNITGESGQDVTLDPSLCHAYLFIETEGAKRESIAKTLKSMTEVVSITSTSGGCDFVVVIKGATFSAVDHVINDYIRPLDGVIRLKHNRIIDLKQL